MPAARSGPECSPGGRSASLCGLLSELSCCCNSSIAAAFLSASVRPLENGGGLLASGGVPILNPVLLSGEVARPPEVAESGEKLRPTLVGDLAPAWWRRTPAASPNGRAERGAEEGEDQPDEGWSTGDTPSDTDALAMSCSSARPVVVDELVRARAASSRTGGTATSIASCGEIEWAAENSTSAERNVVSVDDLRAGRGLPPVRLAGLARNARRGDGDLVLTSLKDMVQVEVRLRRRAMMIMRIQHQTARQAPLRRPLPCERVPRSRAHRPRRTEAGAAKRGRLCGRGDDRGRPARERSLWRERAMRGRGVRPVAVRGEGCSASGRGARD